MPAAARKAEARSRTPMPRHSRMPDQPLWSVREKRARRMSRNHLFRAAFVLLWLLMTAGFAITLYRVLSVATPTPLQIVFLILSTVCFAWVAAGSSSAILGFIALLAGRSINSLPLDATRPRSPDKTALLFPVYREDPSGVTETIDGLCKELARSDASHLFDIFILSDTQDAEGRLREQDAYDALITEWDSTTQIYVRWRTPNIGKKAGNIRDWIETFGADYPFFVVLDADSVMSSGALLRLVAAMEENPRVGLIQTVPRLIGAETLFAHLQQFAAGYYGPVVAAGLAAWHGPGGNYWGHNAIVRTSAFASSAGLPLLPGEPPFGGHILSHDFVEAALLRRGGWEVHMVPALEGSYEGCPPTLSDLIVRDRRWAQGNLQHLRLLTVRGLPFLSRLHLAMGAMAYLASPVWAATLAVGVVLAFQAQHATLSYFGSEPSLFPKWPVFEARTALGLFIATIVVVHIPKLLGGIWALRNRKVRVRNGGVARIAFGIMVESVFATLIAPVLMLTQSSAVLSILSKRDSGWTAQRRTAGNAPIRAYLFQHRWHMAWGAVGTGLCLATSYAVLAWMSPILLGLLLSAPIAQVTSRNAYPALQNILSVHVPDSQADAQERR